VTGAAICVFWGCIGLVGYSYAAYPMLLFVAGSILRASRPLGADGQTSQLGTACPLPAVAVVISAFNEDAHIETRLRNLLSQDYPPELLKVYVGSDGSTDGTNAVLQGFSEPRIVASCFEQNRGKANVLNDLLQQIREPIVVFSDANTQFMPDAIRNLVSAFNDEHVGCVSGELRLLGSGGDNQDSVLWRAEQFLKASESQLGGLLGANGGIYAIRRELYRPLEPDAIIDDFFISMGVAAQGYRLVYRPDAVATEDTPSSIADEYRRRIRIGTGNYQALFRHPEYLLATNLATRFTYISHKVLRWLTPPLLLTALVANVFLASRGRYIPLLVLQCAGYLLCFALYRARHALRVPRLLALPVQLVVLNFAFLVALLRFLRGNYQATWKRTNR
jgi:cellulose synthase/poly-beta-1,6-N-acetylglucosamine synthase-like glycosyltransferase